MAERVALTGNDAVGFAMKQIRPDVVPAFPITPQTELMHKFAEYVADGTVPTELVLVESEHSAMSAAVGASAAGARVMTATSANGFALMWEVVYIAASLRLPIVMSLVNRALSGPLNIHCDHSDAMGGRDSGWIQLWAENTQEAYDNIIMAIRIAESKDVLLPVMVNFDGFIISHTMEVLDILSDEEVQQFVGKYVPQNPLLDTDHPVTIGPLDLPDYYTEHKRQQIEAINNSPATISRITDEYAKLSGRQYGFFEEYRLDDAEIGFVALGSNAGTTKEAVDRLREKGLKVGLLKPRVFRPFPAKLIAQALSHLKLVAVMDRSASFGAMTGPLACEIQSALYGKSSIPVIDHLCGLGGRNISIEEIEQIAWDMDKVLKGKLVVEPQRFVGVRGPAVLEAAAK